MSDRNKSWVCPCNGCAKARKQALIEVRQLADEYINDSPFALHMIYDHIRKETGTDKNAKKSNTN